MTLPECSPLKKENIFPFKPKNSLELYNFIQIDNECKGFEDPESFSILDDFFLKYG